MDNRDTAEAEVLSKISSMFKKYPKVGKRLHEIIMKAEPDLKPRLWYGMPGYAKSKSSAVVCFIREDKYVTFGVTESSNKEVEAAKLNATSWYLTSLSKKVEKEVSDIVKQATK